MKSIALALFLLIVVVYVTGEPKKGTGKRQGGKSMTFKGRKTPKWPGKGCMRNCATCDGRNCIECKEGFTKKYSMRLNKTLCIPGDGCMRNCATCDGRNCMECKEGFTKKYSIRLNKTLCIPGVGCPKDCSLCQGISCKQCDEGFELVRGRFINRTVCKKAKGNCGPRCLECSGPGNCTRCKDGFTLESRRSKAICLVIKDPSRPKGCGKGCKTCTAPKTCTSCALGLKLLFLEQNKTACVRKCPPSTRFDRSSVPAVCTPKELKPKYKGCGRGCLSCDAPRVCTRCTNGLKLLELPGGNRVCLKKCPSFHKLDTNSQTPKCILKKLGKKGGPKRQNPDETP